MRWRFGAGQSIREERAQIEQAKLAGLVNEYLNGQRCSRLIEAEEAASPAPRAQAGQEIPAVTEHDLKRQAATEPPVSQVAGY